MRNVKNLTICGLLLAMVSTAAGTTLYVPSGTYPTIQAAIDAAALTGDEIEVAPGTYYEAINFNGKAIKLYSSGGPTVTTIDGDEANRVVQCDSGEGSDTIMEGFTITNGYCEAGGGMFNGGTNPTVTNCIFSGNSANYGGGMWNFTASPTVTNCTFSSNMATNRGSGMYNEYGSYHTVTNCTFTSNTGGGYGMWNRESTNPTVTNCIFWDNAPGQINNTDGATASVTFSDVQGGYEGTGNIDADPMFADDDGRLLAGSPCIDAGNDAAVPSGVTTDLDGNPRIQGACVDMGAFEAPPVTTEAMLDGLRAYIVGAVALDNIDEEMEVSLLAKVDAAIATLDRDNPNDAKVAMNNLKALVNQVEAQTDKKIDAGVATVIIERANAIIAALGG